MSSNHDSMQHPKSEVPRPLRLGKLMGGRDIHEAHRVSTPLELLFDLTFVVAIAACAAQLHHAAAEQHLTQGLIGFATTFFAIWWAWMNFTWFASAYDTDDTTYRLMTMAQMLGVLVLAAGIGPAAHGDFKIVTIGYVIMRLGLIALWLRAAKDHPERRTTCLRSAIGLGLIQVLWVARLWLPPSLTLPSFFVLGLIEFALPVWAGRAGHTPWHAHHIAERYGLFTIIVLGECVLGASNAVGNVISSTGWTLDVALVGIGSVSLILALWWVYFLVPFGVALHAYRERVFGWGYGHATLFAALAALGAFLGVVADQLRLKPGTGVSAMAPAVSMSSVYSISLVVGAVFVYLVSVWWISAKVTRIAARLHGAWCVSLLMLLLVVFGVHQGLSLPWAIVSITLSPALMIAVVQRGLVKKPEHFVIR